MLDGLEPEYTDTLPASFYCDCNKKKVERVIISIGQKEIQEMIEEGQEIEVNCQFCGSHYKFGVDELKLLLKKAAKK